VHTFLKTQKLGAACQEKPNSVASLPASVTDLEKHIHVCTGNGTSCFSQIKTQGQWLAKELKRLGSTLHRKRRMWMTCPTLEDLKFLSHKLPNPDMLQRGLSRLGVMFHTSFPCWDQPAHGQGLFTAGNVPLHPHNKEGQNQSNREEPPDGQPKKYCFCSAFFFSLLQVLLASSKST